MGIHYMYHSLDYFLECQQELGFKTIEMWCGRPHFLLDDHGYQSTSELKKKVEAHGLHIGVFTPECAMYNYLICAHDEYARKRALGYYTNGIKAAGEVVEGDFDDVLAHLLGVVGVVRQGLRVGYHDEYAFEFARFLQFDAAAQRTHVVSQMKPARRTVAGKNDLSHKTLYIFCGQTYEKPRG